MARSRNGGMWDMIKRSRNGSMQDVKVKKNVKYLFHPFPKHWYTIEWVDFAIFFEFTKVKT